jgi:hypothetical protein
MRKMRDIEIRWEQYDKASFLTQKSPGVFILTHYSSGRKESSTVIKRKTIIETRRQVARSLRYARRNGARVGYAH